MNRRTVLCLVAAFAVIGLACSKSPALKTLTVDDVAARIAAHDGKTFVYDNNPKDGYVQGHVPTAKWVDDENVSAADLPADKGATLIFYCASEL